MENIFKTTYTVERNGKIFHLHWKYRCNPIPMIGGLAGGAGGLLSGAGGMLGGITQMAGPIGKIAGPMMGMLTTREEGKEEQAISKYREAAYEKEARRLDIRAEEQARITKERLIRLLATQKSGAAAANVKMNVGSPLVIASQTKADAAKDIGFALAEGRYRSGFMRDMAAWERYAGKKKKKKSKWDTISQGIGLFGTIADMGLLN